MADFWEKSNSFLGRRDSNPTSMGRGYGSYPIDFSKKGM